MITGGVSVMIGAASVLVMFKFQMIFSSVGACAAVAVRSFCGLKFVFFIYLTSDLWLNQYLEKISHQKLVNRGLRVTILSDCRGDVLFLTVLDSAARCLDARWTRLCQQILVVKVFLTFNSLREEGARVNHGLKCLLYQQDCDKKTNKWRRLSVLSSWIFLGIV